MAGEVNDVLVNSVDALHSLHSAHFVWQEGATGSAKSFVIGFYSGR